MSTEKTVKVVAPSTLDAGYTFEAQVDGKSFTVTVPDGGVKEGEEFEVPYPTEDDAPKEAPLDASADGALTDDVDSPPTGKWRNKLCDCFETCCCPFWMGWCLSGVVLGQVFQRMGLNFCGQKASASTYQNTCMIWTVFAILFLILTIIFGATTGVGAIVALVYVITFVVAGTIARGHFRKQYNIEPSCCGDSCLDDCCVVYWCTCCSVLQMHRHTHDETKYPYNCGSKTGLAPDAPEIV